MAKAEYELYGDFDTILESIDSEVMHNSFLVEKGDSSDFTENDCRCAVRVYDRYSGFGGNRASMNITLLQVGNRIRVTAITSGGRAGTLIKWNQFGDDSFLDTIQDVLKKFKR